eukprot:scaffold5517_cov135-Cylindrotheca_fusiformis.AAC.3
MIVTHARKLYRRWRMLHGGKFVTLLLIQNLFYAGGTPRSPFQAVLEDANYLMLDKQRDRQRKIDRINDAACRRSLSSLQNTVSLVSAERQPPKKSQFWPPWPFNLLRRSNTPQEGNPNHSASTSSYPSSASLFWEYFKQRTRIGARQVKEIGATLYFHLPPALPPFLVLASFPTRVFGDNLKDTKALSRKIVPLFSLPFVRSIACGGLVLTVLSWADMEVHRKRRLTPLLPYHSVSEASVILPPFLPELEPEPELIVLESAEQAAKENGNETIKKELAHADNLSPSLRKHLADLFGIAPRPRNFQSILADWNHAKVARKREAARIRRQTIFDELVALQAIKRGSNRYQKQNRGGAGIGDAGDRQDGQGYALVTGASQGIGRAIAVELARWGIPLVLVSRDVERLTALAYDLEACYSVKCFVLQADLSKADAAENIHRTTSENDIVVDILANNAGVAIEGVCVDTSVSDLERMINVNALTNAKLSCLYGHDMKRRHRGRILMVSSMVGLASSAPNAALYGATKAFGKSLALSMAKELETHGVGVTCLIPGPVTTGFRHSSPGMARALCWYLPFYSKTAESVAHLGIMSLLDGDTQVIPGWQNRFFVKLMRPILPQRLETRCIETAFSPLRLPFPPVFRQRQSKTENKPDFGHGAYKKMPPPRANLEPQHTMQPSPRLLKLEPKEPEDVLETTEEPQETKVSDHEDENNQIDPVQNEDGDGQTTSGSVERDISPNENKNIARSDEHCFHKGESQDSEKCVREENDSSDCIGKALVTPDEPHSRTVHSAISPFLDPIDLMETEKNELL